jgi:hypothetical protein
MAAREIRSPWSTTDVALSSRDSGDFSVYPIPADQPEPVGKATPAQESVVSSTSPTPSAVTSANSADAVKELKAPELPLTLMPPL